MTASPPLSSTIRPLLALALPVLAEEMLNLLVGMTDWWLAGRFVPGDEPKAAMGLMNYVMWLLPSLFAFVGIGATALVSRFSGAGDRRRAEFAARQALTLGLALSVVVFLVCHFGGPAFIRAMQLKGQSADLAVRYLRILNYATPFIMFEQIATACLRGSGDTVSGLLARVLVNLTNAILSAALVTGWGPFPELGWEGLAVGTFCGHLVGAATLLVILLRGRGGLALRMRWEPFDVDLMRRILRVGLPGGCDLITVITCHLFYAAVIYSLGPIAQAAHGLGVQIEAMSYLSGLAFQVAVATLVGQSLGANDAPRAVRTAVTGCGIAMVMMCTAGTIFFLFGENFAHLFAKEASPTTKLTGELLKIVAISCPFLAVLQVLSGALRGAGDTTFPLTITLAGLICIRLPGAVWLAWNEIPIPLLDVTIPAWGWGVHGAWIAMVADVAVRSFLVTGRFVGGKWKHVTV